jgi:hypothetical protein
MSTSRGIRTSDRKRFVGGACALAVAMSGAAWRTPPATGRDPELDTALVFRGSLAPSSRPEFRRVELARAQGGGWEITLDIADPEGIDLDLFVFGQDPRSAVHPDTLCTSVGVGRREACRLVPLPTGAVWVAVVPVQGDRPSEYVLRIHVLRGLVLQGTNLVSGDATPINDSAPVRDGFAPADSGIGGAVGLRLYSVRRSLARAEGWLVSVASDDPTVALSVSAFDTAGALVAASDGAASYQDLRIRPADGRWFILLRLARPADIRKIPAYALSVAPLGAAIPVSLAQGEFRAGGTQDREYSVPLRHGQSATVVLEGHAALAIVIGDSSVPVANSFGSLRQRAWIGSPVGNSNYLLQGAVADQLLRIRVAPRLDTLRYQRRSDWALRVQASSLEQRYLVRFAASSADPWGKWWVDPMRSGTIAPGQIAVIEVPVPPDVSPEGLPSRRAPSATHPQFLARLSEAAAERFDLAVCTEDGQVLDFGDAAVRWDWPNGASIVYLVVLPDPWRADTPGGDFRLELSRSAFSGVK